MAVNINNPGPHAQVVVFALPFEVLNLPFGSWGISYDVSTNLTQFDAPNGWCAWRSATYRALIRHLLVLGFHRHQYSDYRSDQIFGAAAWMASISLKFIDPPMKLETTIQGLKIHFYSHLHLLDVTAFVRIGGPLSRRLRGPIPASLLPAGGIVGINGGPPVPPLPVNFRLPKYTRATVNSSDPYNWVT